MHVFRVDRRAGYAGRRDATRQMTVGLSARAGTIRAYAPAQKEARCVST